VKTYSVMSGLTNSDHSLENTFSYKLRPLITEYVFIQTQITHYRIRVHTNSDHTLQNTFSYKTYSVMSDLSLYENVFCNEWSEFV
jgi:archaellin